MTIAHKIQGESMQMVVCQLEPGQRVYCEAGKFLWKTVNVAVETRFTKGDAEEAGGGGGFLNKALKTGMEMGKRALAGEGLALQHFTSQGGSGLVAFAGVLPGQMQAIELEGTKRWIADKDAFVCAEGTVDFDIQFQSWRSGRKGGEGWVLETFSGTGTLFIAGAGNFIEMNPATYGGKIQVDTGCVLAFEETVTYGVERIGPLNAQTLVGAAFGGEGLNLATLEGDGRVILQSMTYEAMASALFRNIGDDRQGLTGGLLRGGND